MHMFHNVGQQGYQRLRSPLLLGPQADFIGREFGAHPLAGCLRNEAILNRILVGFCGHFNV